MALATIIPDRISIARESRIIFASGVTISATNDLYTLFVAAASGALISSLVKNITVTAPEKPQELNSFLGVDTGNFQNQLFQEKPPTEAKFTGTLILDGNETFEAYVAGSPILTASNTFSRYQIGNAKDIKADVLINISGTTGRQVNIALIQANVNKWGDIKLSGPDGHWEQDISLVTLPKNFYVEYKD